MMRYLIVLLFFASQSFAFELLPVKMWAIGEIEVVEVLHTDGSIEYRATGKGDIGNSNFDVYNGETIYSNNFGEPGFKKPEEGFNPFGKSTLEKKVAKLDEMISSGNLDRESETNAFIILYKIATYHPEEKEIYYDYFKKWTEFAIHQRTLGNLRGEINAFEGWLYKNPEFKAEGTEYLKYLKDTEWTKQEAKDLSF